MVVASSSLGHACRERYLVQLCRLGAAPSSTLELAGRVDTFLPALFLYLSLSVMPMLGGLDAEQHLYAAQEQNIPRTAVVVPSKH